MKVPSLYDANTSRISRDQQVIKPNATNLISRENESQSNSFDASGWKAELNPQNISAASE